MIERPQEAFVKLIFSKRKDSAIFLERRNRNYNDLEVQMHSLKLLPQLRKYIPQAFAGNKKFSNKLIINLQEMGSMNINPLEQARLDNVVHIEQAREETLASKAANILSSGGVIAVPTDTVYGIAASAQNDQAIDRIYKIKGRDFRKPIAICVNSIDSVYKWGKVNVPRSLLLDLLPGSVTLVFERQSELNPNLNPETNLIGIRIPANKFIISLASFHNEPIALTSANFSSSPSTLQVDEFQNLWPLLDIVYDGGPLSFCEKTEKAARAGSTVIDLSCKGFYHIIRDGTVKTQCVQILQDKYNLKKLVTNCA